jgi:hypothetical protein
MLVRVDLGRAFLFDMERGEQKIHKAAQNSPS